MSGDILDRKKVFSGFKISNSCVGAARNVSPDLSQKTMTCPRGRGGGVLPHKGLMRTCDQPGYVFRDFCLKQGIEFIIFLS